MAYSADSFSAGEQPTTAKWNKLWANDASFNDGTGIADGAIQPHNLIAGTGTSWVWTAYTPTVTSGAGTLTTATGAGRYIQIGKTVYFTAAATITTVGSGSGACLITLPVTGQTATGYAGSGREDAISGKMLQVKLNTASQVAAANYDGTSPLASGSIVRISGFYEAA